jgi:hypothetical protein
MKALTFNITSLVKPYITPKLVRLLRSVSGTPSLDSRSLTEFLGILLAGSVATYNSCACAAAATRTESKKVKRGLKILVNANRLKKEFTLRFELLPD